MKKLSLLTLLLCFVCTTSNAENLASQEVNKVEDSILDQFDAGKTTNAEDFFEGIVEHVVRVDVQIRKIFILDSVGETHLDPFKECISIIQNEVKTFRKILKKYKEPQFVFQAAFVSITHKWLNEIMYLMDEHVSSLIEYFVIEDDKWTDEQIDEYELYYEDYKVFTQIDLIWIDAQNTFAEKNNFELSDEVIDVDDRL